MDCHSRCQLPGVCVVAGILHQRANHLRTGGRGRAPAAHVQAVMACGAAPVSESAALGDAHYEMLKQAPASRPLIVMLTTSADS